ncbi:MAG: hypothetical protein WAN65_10105 [Candidatus Sulfotelmatobacter sp.]
MQEHKYDELRSETAREMSDELFGANAHQRAEQALKAAIARKVEQMTADGRAFTLTDEEERIIKSFRRFKANCKKDGEVFKWQTRRVEGVTEAPETVFVRDPQEVS